MTAGAPRTDTHAYGASGVRELFNALSLGA